MFVFLGRTEKNKHDIMSDDPLKHLAEPAFLK